MTPPLPSGALRPRHWPTWVAIAAAWLLARLPVALHRPIGRLLGTLILRSGARRARIAQTNLALCFPDKSVEALNSLTRKCLQELVIGTLEMAVAWLRPSYDPRSRTTISGAEHLETALATGRGVILVGGHFAVMDMIARPLAQFGAVDVIYRRNKDPAWEWAQVYGRKHYFDGVIERSETRNILRALKRGRAIWYAADQDYGRQHSVFAPFFQVPAATITAAARLARMNNSVVLFMSQHRREDEPGWELTILRPHRALSDRRRRRRRHAAEPGPGAGDRTVSGPVPVGAQALQDPPAGQGGLLPVKVLGLGGALGHDAAAALVADGRILAAAEEERFSRSKHARGALPEAAAGYCLDASGIDASQLDAIAIPFAPISLRRRDRWHYARRYWYAPDRGLDALLNGNRRYRRFARRARALAEALGVDWQRTRFVPVEHHLAHASSAYHLSGFEGPTAILGVDGKGEYATTFFGCGEGGRITTRHQCIDPDSLAGVYGALTEYLGFDMLDGEFKVMGMAAYGDPDAISLDRLLHPTRDEFRVATELVNTVGLRRYKADGRGHYFSRKLVDWLGPPRSRSFDISGSSVGGDQSFWAGRRPRRPRRSGPGACGHGEST